MCWQVFYLIFPCVSSIYNLMIVYDSMRGVYVAHRIGIKSTLSDRQLYTASLKASEARSSSFIEFQD